MAFKNKNKNKNNNYYFYFYIIFGIIIILILCSKQKHYTNSNIFNFINDDAGKMKIYDSCKFSGDGFINSHEIGECSVAVQVIPLCKNVLEIGGGSGKISHMINSILQKRGLGNKHIVMEPGDGGTGNHGDVHIYNNKKNFNDKYTILKKFANDLTMRDLQILDNKPDCLYVDCEGCLHAFFETEIGKYCLQNARFVVNENDSFVIGKKQEDLSNILKKFSFNKISVGYGCGVNCETEI